MEREFKSGRVREIREIYEWKENGLLKEALTNGYRGPNGEENDDRFILTVRAPGFDKKPL